jgi:hypothetical protein
MGRYFMKLDYETLLEKVIQARFIMTTSDNHEEVMRAIKTRRGYERIARESGIDMDGFKNKSRELYLNLVFNKS